MVTHHWIKGAMAAFATLLALNAPAAPVTAENPAKVPDRIVTSLSGDPATEFSVTWHTDEPSSTPLAQISLATIHPKKADEPTTVTATHNPVEHLPGKTAHYYEATFKNLKPDTTYMYRVGDRRTWSEWFDVTTASDKPEPFSFMYLGDEQAGLRSTWPRSIRAAFSLAPQVDFIVHAGDNVNDGYNDVAWEHWNAAWSFITGMRPSIATSGNHDTHRAPATPKARELRSAHPMWRAHFVFPDNGPEGLEEVLDDQTYYVDYQAARLIVINTNLYTGGQPPELQQAPKAQSEWLDKALAENPHPWAIVLHHHPVYSVGQQRDSSKLQQALGPIYDKHGVDLVLQGHDHIYARTNKVANGAVVSPDAKGTVYAVSVSGPTMYKPNPAHEKLMAIRVPETQMFQVVEVAPETLTFKAFSIDGQMQDGFELRKDKSGKSVLSDARD